MSILDRSFLKSITNPIPAISDYRLFSNFYRRKIKHLLNAELLSHIVDENYYADFTCFLLYKYEDKYILIHMFVGTCSECLTLSYNNIILNAIERAFVSTSIEDIEKYYLNKLSNESTFKKNKNIYYLYPEKPV
jgi:hypothetical protein